MRARPTAPWFSLPLMAVALAAGCPEPTGEGEGEGEGEAGVYEFPSRFVEGASSVSYTGQASRHLLIAELKAFIGAIDDTTYLGADAARVIGDLGYFLNFKNQGGTPEEPITVRVGGMPLLQTTFGEVSSPTSLREKMADIDLGSALRVKGYRSGELLPSEVADDMFASLAALLVERANGAVPRDPSGADIAAPFVGADGIDWQQLIQKYLDGAVPFSQACDDYLDDEEAGEGILSDNVAQVAGKPYTVLEHAWDEAFGYFGASRRYGAQSVEQNAAGFVDVDGDARLDWLTEVNLGHSRNAAQRDHESDTAAPTSFSRDAFEAFVAGRRIIAGAAGALSGEELDELRRLRTLATLSWEKAIAASVVHYLNEVVREMKAAPADYSFLRHAKHWSEMKGFLLALAFNPRSPFAGSLSAAHALVGAAPVLSPAGFEAYTADLLAARGLIGAAYGFAPENLGDDDGEGGW
jgi:hypothetical protein